MKRKNKKLINLMVCMTAAIPYAAAQTTDAPLLCEAERTEDTCLGVDSARTEKKEKKCIYELPYSTKTSCPDYKRMWTNTGVLFAGGLATLGVLEMLPEGSTAWNKEELRKTPFLKRWSMHVRKGPVWDKDDFIFNYVLHPYAGAAYYMSARSLGFNMLGSFLYCTGISTIFWEYGIEAFMEIPSIQDLIITPVSGIVLGEAFYKLKRHIVNNGYRLFDSKVLGNIVAFIIDPVNEVIGLFAGNPCRKLSQKTNMCCTPWISTINGNSFGLTFSLIR